MLSFICFNICVFLYLFQHENRDVPLFPTKYRNQERQCEGQICMVNTQTEGKDKAAVSSETKQIASRNVLEILSSQQLYLSKTYTNTGIHGICILWKGIITVVSPLYM